MTAAHETSNAFSDEVLREHLVFELQKQEEMMEMLGRYADGQVEMLQRAMDDWDKVSVMAVMLWPFSDAIRSSPSCSVSVSTSSHVRSVRR